MKNFLFKSKVNYCIKSTIALFVLVCFGLIVKPAVTKAGTFGMFEFSMDSKTNEITITGLNGSGAEATNIVIPSQINGYNVTRLGNRCFEERSNIVSVSFEAGSMLTEIGDSAFSGATSLSSIVIPASVRTIGEFCFNECTSLTAISIPEGVTALDSGTFQKCTSLNSVTLPSTLTKLSSAWGNCFSGCTSLKSLIIPNGVTSIAYETFENSGLESIVIPDSVTFMDFSVFKGCRNLVSVSISNNLKTIPGGAFQDCTSLKNVSLPIDVEYIRHDAFNGCSELESLTLGDAIKDIDRDVFTGCPKLTVRVVRGTVAESYCMNNNISFITYASSIGGCKINGIVEKPYTGAAQTQNLVISLGTTVLAENVDYTVTYSNNVNVGTATVLITGTGNYVGKIQKTFKISAVNLATAKIHVKSKVKYNAKYQTPAVKVTLNGNIIPSNYYSVSYYGNCFVGTATVTVNGKGNYRGTVRTTFTIVPKGTKIKSVKRGSKSITVSYKENHIQTSGYQIQYSTDKKFKKNCKIATVNNNKKKSKTITGLKARKKYYVRVRTYMLVGGKKISSSWTPAKAVKTK